MCWSPDLLTDSRGRKAHIWPADAAAPVLTPWNTDGSQKVAVWYGSYKYFKIPKSPFIIHYWDDFGTSKKSATVCGANVITCRPVLVNDVKTRFVTWSIDLRRSCAAYRQERFCIGATRCVKSLNSTLLDWWLAGFRFLQPLESSALFKTVLVYEQNGLRSECSV